MMLKIFNGQVITPAGIVKNGSLLIKDGAIAEVSSSSIDASGALEFDAEGKFISPGFIDIHIHGGGGHDFMDNTIDAFLGVAELHVKHGTTAMLPTTLSCEKADLLETLRIYEEANKLNTKGSQFIGIHIEARSSGPSLYTRTQPGGIQGDTINLKVDQKMECRAGIKRSD
jgi:N-acetylglucosamine-6-phosphate deacetylase